MKKVLLVVSALFLLSAPMFANSTVFAACTVPSSATVFSFAGGTGTSSAANTFTCEGVGSTGFNLDGLGYTLVSVAFYIDSDYDTCGGFAGCTNEDVRVSYTPQATIWNSNPSTIYEDVFGASGGVASTGSVMYSINGSSPNFQPDQYVQVCPPGTLPAGTNPGTCSSVTSVPLSLVVGNAFDTGFTVSTSSSLVSGSGAPNNSTAQVEVVYTYGTTSVPEPVTMLLFGTGLLGLSIVGRKKLVRK